MFEGFRFADALVAVSNNILDEQIDSLKRFAILGLPPEAILPSCLIPIEDHGSVLDKVVLGSVASLKALDRIKQSTSVGGGAQQVGSLSQ